MDESGVTNQSFPDESLYIRSSSPVFLPTCASLTRNSESQAVLQPSPNQTIESQFNDNDKNVNLTNASAQLVDDSHFSDDRHFNHTNVTAHMIDDYALMAKKLADTMEKYLRLKEDF